MWIHGFQTEGITLSVPWLYTNDWNFSYGVSSNYQCPFIFSNFRVSESSLDEVMGCGPSSTSQWEREKGFALGAIANKFWNSETFCRPTRDKTVLRRRQYLSLRSKWDNDCSVGRSLSLTVPLSHATYPSNFQTEPIGVNRILNNDTSVVVFFVSGTVKCCYSLDLNISSFLLLPTEHLMAIAHATYFCPSPLEKILPLGHH